MGIEAIQAREAAHFLPVVNRLPVAIVEGCGSRVRDVDGRELIDLTAGWGVCSIGHCHPELVEAIREQAGTAHADDEPLLHAAAARADRAAGRALRRGARRARSS